MSLAGRLSALVPSGLGLGTCAAAGPVVADYLGATAWSIEYRGQRWGGPLEGEHQLSVSLTLDGLEVGGWTISGPTAFGPEQEQELLLLSRLLVAELTALEAVIGRAAGTLAHKLNNPLGALQLSIDAASFALDTRPDQAEAKLERSQIALQKARWMVDGLLYYARETQALGQAPVDLNECIREALGEFGAFPELKVELARELLLTPANPMELKLAVIHLLQNAQQAVAEKPGPVQLRSQRVADQVQLVISDWGPGVTRPERIFEPFFTTRKKGVGLGLALVSTIAGRLGGRLQLTSHADPTTFCLELPASP
ncbi:MAG: sensor histidine kinase [Vulcanimicrobiota bacterium]